MNLTIDDFIKHKLNWNVNQIKLVEKLGGLSSDNYKVVYNDTAYFLRVCPHTYLHTNRSLELEVINKAAKVGLCKTPYYYSCDDGYMVSPWLHGTMPKEADFYSYKFIHSLTKNLKNLHGLTCDTEFTPFDHIKKRIELCKNYSIPLPSSIDLILTTLNHLESKLNHTKIMGLCHNDLNASNIILSNDKIYFVDYEYSSMGDVFFDLATLGWFMTPVHRKYLLKSYFGFYKDEYYERLLNYLYVVKLYNATWSLLKSKDSLGEYDYLKGAYMIFEDLLNFESIRI